MNDFMFFLQMGLKHILSWGAADHLLFVIVLTCVFTIREAGKIFWLITAFTIGHAITLVASSFDWIKINNHWVELAIAASIVFTALLNLFQNQRKSSHIIQFIVALVFGLIHGLGFAGTIKHLLAAEQSLVLPLFAFNTGLELGQLIVVAMLMCVEWLTGKVGLSRKRWIQVVSIISLIWGIYLMSGRF